MMPCLLLDAVVGGIATIGATKLISNAAAAAIDKDKQSSQQEATQDAGAADANNH